jgi:hypothetical protein
VLTGVVGLCGSSERFGNDVCIGRWVLGREGERVGLGQARA